MEEEHWRGSAEKVGEALKKLIREYQGSHVQREYHAFELQWKVVSVKVATFRALSVILDFAHWWIPAEQPISEQVWRASLRILTGTLKFMTDD